MIARNFILLCISFSVFCKENFIVDRRKIVDNVIWSIKSVDKENIILSTRNGKIYFYNLSNSRLQNIEHSIQPEVKGQGGLLDIYLHKKKVYLSYSKKINASITTALFKGDIKNNILRGKDIFIANTKSSTHHHFGSRIEIDDKEQIYLTIGDRGMRDEAQKLNNHHGKILRMDLNGRPIKENPFKEFPYIYSYGHRNPQGLIFNNDQSILFEAEFGPKGGDELNIIEKGKNYGWPVITYGREYHGPQIGKTHHKNMEQPLVYWTPSISPSAITYYSHHYFQNWKDSIFLANLSSTHLRRVQLTSDNKVLNQEILLNDLGLRLRSLHILRDGKILIGTDSGELVILKKK